MSNPESDPLLFVFFTEIGIIEQLARNRFERVLPDDLRLPHFAVLNHFVRLEREESPTQLARAFQVTKGAMTNTIQRLRARGLVEVRPDPGDGRAKIVSITDRGRRVRADSIAAIAPVLKQLAHELPEPDLARVLPFLQTVRVYLDRARDVESAGGA